MKRKRAVDPHGRGCPLLHDYDAPWDLRREIDLIKRAYALRKARRIRLILVDCGRVYVCDNEHDPWGSKRYVSWLQFEAMIIEAEAAPARQAAGSEAGMETVIEEVA